MAIWFEHKRGEDKWDRAAVREEYSTRMWNYGNFVMIRGAAREAGGAKVLSEAGRAEARPEAVEETVKAEMRLEAKDG